jgi:hypothetical protein
MSRFAKIDENGLVVDVVVADSAELLTELVGGSWVETFTDGTRKQRASKGFTYDAKNDVFVSPQSYPSWILNDSFDWVAPVPQPDNVYKATWDENSGDWDIIVDGPPEDGKGYVWDGSQWVDSGIPADWKP